MVMLLLHVYFVVWSDDMFEFVNAATKRLRCSSLRRGFMFCYIIEAYCHAIKEWHFAILISKYVTSVAND